MRFFNTAGPTIPEDHYHIDPLTRVDWQEITTLIDHKRYFLLHAPRQTGKTTLLLTMMEVINRKGKYACAYANIEAAQAARHDVDSGIETICSAVAGSISLYLGDEALEAWFRTGPGAAMPAKDQLFQLLKHWTLTSRKPTVLLLDEVDALVGDVLISLLRQIRAGYGQHPAAFPHALILCGVRDIQDYRIHTKDKEIITGGSAFNIKAKSLRMGNFTYEECVELWKQHTQETGQTFEDAIFPELWEDTKGQPWLVNALGHELTWELRKLRDRTLPITFLHYQEAKENLIQSRQTHLDQLVAKLKEGRVHRVIAPLLANQTEEIRFQESDLQYVYDLGLITIKPSIKISNRIYQEILPRALTYGTQYGIPNQETAWYVKEEGKLDTPKLLQAFQQFFRENADSWIERFDYKEAGPQLLMQAFLQRIINGGGRINREYALGRGRTDLLIEWPATEQGHFGPVQKVVIELKILHKGLESTITKGIEQTKAYADKAGAEESHLVIFDRTSNKSWEEKLWCKELEGIGVWGC